MDAIVAELVEKSPLHLGALGIGMDVAQRIKDPFRIRPGKSTTVVTFFPKMPGSIQHLVKAHSRIPVQPMHDLGQIIGVFGFQQIVNMIAHDAKGIELELKFLQCCLDGIEQDLAALPAIQQELAVIATGSDVIAILGL